MRSYIYFRVGYGVFVCACCKKWGLGSGEGVGSIFLVKLFYSSLSHILRSSEVLLFQSLKLAFTCDFMNL